MLEYDWFSDCCLSRCSETRRPALSGIQCPEGELFLIFGLQMRKKQKSKRMATTEKHLHGLQTKDSKTLANFFRTRSFFKVSTKVVQLFPSFSRSDALFKNSRLSISFQKN